MDIILKITKNFINENFIYNGWTNEELIIKTRNKLNDIDSKLHKIKFLTIFVEIANEEYLKHTLKCYNSENCPTDFEYDSLIYYLQQELERLDVVINEDTFTKEDIKNLELRLQDLITKIDELKLGQQITYDDLLNEFEEIKSFYYLGKKRWSQILLGKLTEMTLGGIISDTASKEILNLIKKIPNLLNQ